MPVLHRLLVLSFLLFWSGRSEAGAKTAKRKGPSMTERILFQSTPSSDWISGLKVEVLGKSPKGTWLAADDATALELLKRDKTTLALYPTRAVYIEAMEGLKEAEVTEAIHLRLALVEGNPESNSVPDFYFSEREGLEAIAAAADASGKGAALDAAFAAQLDAIRSINGPDAYRGQDKISLLEGIFEDLNKLNWEEEALRRHPNVGLPPLEPALEKSRKELALEIQRAERQVGVKYDHEPEGRVLNRLERGIFAKPLDEKLVKGIADGHEPVHKWKDGFVAIWGEYQLQQVPMADKEKTFLYFDAEECTGEFMSLTKAQLTQAFNRKSKQTKASDAAAYLSRLRLTLVLELLGRQEPVGKFNPALQVKFGTQAKREIAALQSFLASQHPWRKPSKPAVALRAELQAPLKEIDYWRAWTAAKFWAHEQESLDRLSAAKGKVISLLPKDL